jgi:6-phosphofructokinase
VGIPQTIDNDILLLDKTFGFDTAVEEAQRDAAAAVGCTARLEQRMLILYVASAQVVPIQQL